MTRNYTNTIGKRIRLLRQDLGVKQQDLATAIGITPSHMSQIEKGIKQPTAATLTALARELKTTTDYLLMLDEEDERSAVQPEADAPGFSEQAEEAARLIDALHITAHRQYCVDMIRLFVGMRGASNEEWAGEIKSVIEGVGLDEAHLVSQHVINRQTLPEPSEFLDTSAKRKRPQTPTPVN